MIYYVVPSFAVSEIINVAESNGTDWDIWDTSEDGQMVELGLDTWVACKAIAERHCKAAGLEFDYSSYKEQPKEIGRDLEDDEVDIEMFPADVIDEAMNIYQEGDS